MKKIAIYCLICFFDFGNCMLPLIDNNTVISQLANTDWDTQDLANALAQSHYITDNEAGSNLSPGKHKVRISAGKKSSTKNAMVLINLQRIRAAILAEKENHFDGCLVQKAPESGEFDFRFSETGKSMLAGIDIYVYGKRRWEIDERLKIVAVRAAPGETSISHFYPLIE